MTTLQFPVASYKDAALKGLWRRLTDMHAVWAIGAELVHRGYLYEVEADRWVRRP